MNPQDLHKIGADIGPSIIVTAAVGLFILLGFLTFRLISSNNILADVPELKGIPVLGYLSIEYLSFSEESFPLATVVSHTPMLSIKPYFQFTIQP